jgi:hypothetical protein
MKNLIKLHEAVILILLPKPNMTATFEQIAEEIEKRRLFPNRKGNISLSKQIELRTSISSSRYKHYFKNTVKGQITLNIS